MINTNPYQEIWEAVSYLIAAILGFLVSKIKKLKKQKETNE